jgi:hypothetical protein
MAKRSKRIDHSKFRIGVASGAAILLFIIVYLLVLPAVLSHRYKGAIEPTQKSLSEKVTQAGETFKLGVFSQDRSGAVPDNATTEVQMQALDADKADLKTAHDATAAAQAKLSETTPELTGFKKMPLMSVNNDYRIAVTVDGDEEAYTATSREFLTSYQQLIDYADKSTDLSKQLVAAGAVLDNPPEDLSAIAATLDQLAVKNTEAVNEFKKLTPPEYLKAEHDKDIASAEQVSKDLQSLAGAVRSLDLGTIQSITAKLESQAKTNKAETATFITKLQTESPYKKQIDQLKQLNDSIAANLVAI